MKMLLTIHDQIAIPPGISCVSAVARRSGHQIEVACLSRRDLAGTARRFQPDVIAFGGIKWLTRPHLDGIYDVLDRTWKNYCIKQRDFPYSMPATEFVRNTLSYLRSRYY